MAELPASEDDSVAARAAGVAATARALVAAGLIEAFGHVSTRLTDGDILITPTTPLGRLGSDQVVRVDPDGRGDPGSRAPLESAMHAAIYRARSDVNAICRGHGASMVAWGTGFAELPVLHGLGLLAGRSVRVHRDPDLVTTATAGDRVAATLGADASVILRGNGGLSVGSDLLEAATRLWFLEERCAVALSAPADTEPIPDALWEQRGEHCDAELERARAWFAATFDEADPTNDRRAP